MKRTRILKEEKYFIIQSYDCSDFGQGYGGTAKGQVYYHEPFISEQDCQEKLEIAIKDWEKYKGWGPYKPKLQIYWKVLNEQIIEENEE